MQVKIGPKFFANELRVYRDWTTAFWRENIQNSFDAGATRMDITIGASHDGVSHIRFTDNGCGMDRETLEKVYFTLGETTKTGNSVGGFGKARILTCFAQKGYTLRTNKLLVTGEGADYLIEDCETKTHGVILEIDVYDKGVDLHKALTNYLNRCHLGSCQIVINGVAHKDWTYKNKFERTLSFGKIYTNKSKHAGVHVRVNGVHMFSPYCSAPFLVIVEIDQDRSREVLQASRDGLLQEYQSELESFVNELNINKQSALRQKKSKSIKYEGTGTFTAKRSKGLTAEQVADQFDGLLASNEITVQDGGAAFRDIILKAKNPEVAAAKLIEHLKTQGVNLTIPEPVITEGRLHSSGHDIEEEERQLGMDLFNVIVEDDTTNPSVRKVIETYYPNNWDLLGQIGSRYDKRYGEVRSFRAGVEKYKLLVLWKAACEYCIRLLQDELQRGDEAIAWGVGWCFTDPTPGDNAAAMFKRDGGINWLMINPVKPNGNMRIAMSNKRDLIRVIGSAAHEVCHIICGDHDERFANLLNDLMEECMFHQSAIIAHMKQSKDEAVQRLDRLEEAAKAA